MGNDKKKTNKPPIKKKAIESPEKFWELFVEFRTFKLSQKVKQQVITKAGIQIIEHTPPLTWRSFDAWLFEHKNILQNTEHYRNNLNGSYTAYLGITRAIDSIMYAQKFDGAACGVYSHNIIARDLGLVDKKEHNVKESDEPTEEELLEKLRKLEENVKSSRKD